MINEMIKKVAEKAGISSEKAATTIIIVLETLKKKLPEPIAGQIDNLLGIESAPGVIDKAKDAASDMLEGAKEKFESLFHKK